MSTKAAGYEMGRPQQFSGKVDVNDLDMTVFKEDYCVSGKLVYKMYLADVWAKEAVDSLIQ